MKSKYIPSQIMKKLSKLDQKKIIEAENLQDIHGNVKNPKVKQVLNNLYK